MKHRAICQECAKDYRTRHREGHLVTVGECPTCHDPEFSVPACRCETCEAVG